MENRLSFQSLLRRELTERTRKNPRYSLRAFAQSMGVDPAVLSRILSGKRLPSGAVADRILSRLSLHPDEARSFKDSIQSAYRRRSGKAPIQELLPFEPIDDDIFSIISDWYHYAILELIHEPDFDPSSRWIAKQLGIEPVEAKLALERLVSCGLIQKSKTGYARTKAWVTTTDKTMTNSALRKRQRQILEKSISSLEEDPIDVRNHTTMTMSIDPKRMTQAKGMVLEFQRKLCAFLEKGDRTHVYELSVSLFPLQRRQAVIGGKKEKNR